MSKSPTCPRCGATDVLLVGGDDFKDWEIDPEEYDEFAEVWVCQNYRGINLCGWHEEADPDEAHEEHLRQIEWLGQRLAQINEKKA